MHIHWEISSLEKEAGFPEVHEIDFEDLLKTLSNPLMKVCVCVKFLQIAYCVSATVLSTLYVFIYSSLQSYDIGTIVIHKTGKEAEAHGIQAGGPRGLAVHRHSTPPLFRPVNN